MNLSELRTATRNLLNEEVPGFWSDAQLNSYINLGVLRVNSIISGIREDFFTVSATFVMTAGTSLYALPSDCRFVRRIEIYDPTDPNSIIKIDEMKFPRLEANGDWLFTQNAQPKKFVLINNQMRFLPIPDSTYNIRIYYDARPVTLADDADAPTAPEDFHDLIVFWACILAKKQNEDDDAGFGTLFNIRKSELIETLTRRGGEDSLPVEAYLQGII